MIVSYFVNIITIKNLLPISNILYLNLDAKYPKLDKRIVYIYLS